MRSSSSAMATVRRPQGRGTRVRCVVVPDRRSPRLRSRVCRRAQAPRARLCALRRALQSSWEAVGRSSTCTRRSYSSCHPHRHASVSLVRLARRLGPPPRRPVPTRTPQAHRHTQRRWHLLFTSHRGLACLLPRLVADPLPRHFISLSCVCWRLCLWCPAVHRWRARVPDFVPCPPFLPSQGLLRLTSSTLASDGATVRMRGGGAGATSESAARVRRRSFPSFSLWVCVSVSVCPLIGGASPPLPPPTHAGGPPALSPVPHRRRAALGWLMCRRCVAPPVLAILFLSFRFAFSCVFLCGRLALCRVVVARRGVGRAVAVGALVRVAASLGAVPGRRSISRHSLACPPCSPPPPPYAHA